MNGIEWLNNEIEVRKRVRKEWEIASALRDITLGRTQNPIDKIDSEIKMIRKIISLIEDNESRKTEPSKTQNYDVPRT